MAHVLLLMPRALYILLRFGAACQRQGLDLTVMMASNPPAKRYLASFVDDIYRNVLEIPVAEDDAAALSPLLPPVDAVVAGGEFSVVLAEELALKLGLFHNPIEQAGAYRNKHRMRMVFAEQGVDQPRILARFARLEEADRFAWDTVPFPVIVKPVDLTASVHVRLCADAGEARGVLRRIFKHAQSFGGAAFAGEGLVEEAVSGPEYSAECVVQGGELIRWFLTTKFVSPYPACDEMAHLSGEALPALIVAKVEAAIGGVIRAWRLESAVMHVEFKLCRGEVKVIEAACRIGGDMIPEIVELEHRVSLEECLVLLRAGRDVRAALARSATAADGRCHAIQYLFAENIDRPIPAGIDVLREHRTAHPDAGPPPPGTGFGVEKRLGYRILRSRSLARLRDHLAEFCGDGEVPSRPASASAA